jgi:hypothetical protein
VVAHLTGLRVLSAVRRQGLVRSSLIARLAPQHPSGLPLQTQLHAPRLVLGRGLRSLAGAWVAIAAAISLPSCPTARPIAATMAS